MILELIEVMDKSHLSIDEQIEFLEEVKFRVDKMIKDKKKKREDLCNYYKNNKI